MGDSSSAAFVTPNAKLNNVRLAVSSKKRRRRSQLRLWVGTANLGNALPDAASVARWIPPDGCFFVQEDSLDEQADWTLLEGEDEENWEEEGEEDISNNIEKEKARENPQKPYQSKYPIIRELKDDPNAPGASGASGSFNNEQETDEADDNEKELIGKEETASADALSSQLDLIVIGLQEATFDPPKPETMASPTERSVSSAESESISPIASNGSVRIRVPMVKPLRKLQTLRTARDYSDHPDDRNDLRRPLHRLVTGHRLLTVCKPEEWDDGTHALHSLFEGRLPSYSRLVSYQRGQMRLLIFGRTQSSSPSDDGNDPILPLKVLHTAAQNTGLTGLANKGGIVSEILVNGTTRLSFVSCHLEAHEGSAKCAIRCRTMGEILKGTAARKNTAISSNDSPCPGPSQHFPQSPSVHSNHYGSSNVAATAIDVSLTAHYCFVLGDLNFRTDLALIDRNLADHDDAHKQSVFHMVAAKDWVGLNRADELRHAVRNNQTLAGFQTLVCNFPPTFKVERQVGYRYIEKRRPSYTDRILFKTGHRLDGGIRPLLYEPIDDFSTSDHKPVRGAFSVNLNPSFRVRPRVVRRESMRWKRLPVDTAAMNDSPSGVRKPLRRLWRVFGACVKDEADDVDNMSMTSHASVVDLRHGQGLGLTGDQLQLYVSNIVVELDQSQGSLHGSRHGAGLVSAGPNPYVLLMTQPEEAIRLTSWTRTRLLRRMLHRFMGRAGFVTERTKNGWPCSSTKMSIFAVDWEGEEIRCQVATHTPHGGSIDLSGAILFLTVMNEGTSEDSMIGSFAFNLADLLKTSTEKKSLSFGGRNVRQSVRLGDPPSQNHRMQQRSIWGSIFGAGSDTEHRGSSERRQARNHENAMEEQEEEEDDEYDDDPFTTVQINDPIYKGGVEVGRLSCTVEAWWVDETTARVVRVSEARKPDNRQGVRPGRHSDAHLRRTIVHTS